MFTVFCVVKMLYEKINEYKYEQYVNNAESMTSAIYNRLQKTSWEKLSYEDRVDLMLEVLETEKYVLSIDEVNVYFVNLDDTNNTSVAFYTPNNNTISFSTKYLQRSSVEDAIYTICHEIYHAYEYSLAQKYRNLPYKSRIKLEHFRIKNYSDEFNNYISKEESRALYIDQLIETDSRTYALNRVATYIDYTKLRRTDL